jgi:hypothetical protein
MRKRFSGVRAKRAGLLLTLVVGAAVVMLLPASVGAIVAGAGYTTTNIPPDPAGSCFNGPGVVNCNIYATKSAVWINGGPTNGTSALSDGTYFFVVGVPGGENSDINDAGTVPDDGTGTPKNLSDDFDAYTSRTFTVVNNHISATSGTHDFVNGKIRLAPYSDTTNPGGEYFVALCRIDTPATAGYPADPSQCKYDNFKVKENETCEEDCVVEFGVVSGAKYYDANTSGSRDPGEVGIPNWPIDFTDGVANTLITDSNGEFSVNLSPDTYTFAEEVANSPWMQTGNTSDQSSSSGGNSATLNANKSYTVVVANAGTTSGILFGNVCLGAGGGLTLGFWSNKNGQALVGATDLAMLVGLNLRNANGTDFNPANYAGFRTWLLSATATNMAYMLSAQLAAMELNVFNGLVDGTKLIYAPGTTSANANGFATVNAVMAEANSELGLHGSTLDGSPYRAYQEALKNALDKANNNLNFVQPTPATCPTPVFPS